MKIRVKRHEVTQPPDQSIRLIPLTQDRNAIVDAIDYDFLMQWNWHTHKKSYGEKYYAARSLSGDILMMHNVILPVRRGLEVDHIDGDGLNNRKNNLRPATHSQNQKNRKKQKSKSGFKGISLDKRYTNKKWRVYINSNGKRINCGGYATQEDAARIYDEAAKKYHGDFAALNFPST